MRTWFDGTYYKHQKDGQTICFIAGRADSGGFVQVITNEKVWQYEGLEGFQADSRGVRVDLPEVQGEIKYGDFLSLKSDIMGPFRFLPMQCSHRVVSMEHSLSGSFVLEGKDLDLTGGKGYIEGDRGRSFPKEYLWLHCNDFSEPCSIMASVADIPFCGTRFMGCICAVCYRGKEYRLATYYGVKIRHAGNKKLVLEQGSYRLEAYFSSQESHPLKAPKLGKMTDTIHESNCSPARFRFWERQNLLFDLTSRNASFECNLKSIT